MARFQGAHIAHLLEYVHLCSCCYSEITASCMKWATAGTTPPPWGKTPRKGNPKLTFLGMCNRSGHLRVRPTGAAVLPLPSPMQSVPSWMIASTQTQEAEPYQQRTGAPISQHDKSAGRSAGVIGMVVLVYAGQSAEQLGMPAALSRGFAHSSDPAATAGGCYFQCRKSLRPVLTECSVLSGTPADQPDRQPRSCRRCSC